MEDEDGRELEDWHAWLRWCACAYVVGFDGTVCVRADSRSLDLSAELHFLVSRWLEFGYLTQAIVDHLQLCAVLCFLRHLGASPGIASMESFSSLDKYQHLSTPKPFLSTDLSFVDLV